MLLDLILCNLIIGLSLNSTQVDLNCKYRKILMKIYVKLALRGSIEGYPSFSHKYIYQLKLP
jgi:hypothetical protein